MQKKIIKVSITAIITSIILSSFISNNIYRNPTKFNEKIENEKDEIKFRPKIALDFPLFIAGDNELALEADYGSGTQGEPYVIENKIINKTGSAGPCIGLTNTSKYVIIKNCTTISGDAGIYLYNSTNVIITNNTAYGLNPGSPWVKIGIQISAFSKNVTIYDNYVNDNRYGIYIYNSTFINITSNKVYDNYSRGVGLRNSNNNTIYDNNIRNNSIGILLWNSHNNIISENNVIQNLNDAVELEESDNNTIIHNTIYNNKDTGIYLEESNNNDIIENDIRNNAYYGIRLFRSNNTDIIGNTLYCNGDCWSETECENNFFIDNKCGCSLGDDENGNDGTKGNNELNFIPILIFSSILVSLGIVTGLSAYHYKNRAAKILKKELKNNEIRNRYKKDKVSGRYKRKLTITKSESSDLKSPKTKKQVKKKKTISPLFNFQSLENKIEKEKEIEKIKKELDIEEKEDVCLVHRGVLSGVAYICPKCKTKYCLKCAETLKKQKETCWVCAELIDIELKNGHENKDTSIQKFKQFNLKQSSEEYKNLLKSLNEENALENTELFSNLEITAITNKFWEKVDKLDLDEKDRKEFIKNMLSLKPKERQEILDEMLKLRELDFENLN